MDPETRPCWALRSDFFFRLLVTVARATFWASPKPEASLFGPNLCKIHKTPVFGATSPGLKLLLDNFLVLCIEEIPARNVVADETAHFLADIHRRFPSLGLQFWKHLAVMLVAKHVKVCLRTGTQSFLLACYVRGEHR